MLIKNDGRQQFSRMEFIYIHMLDVFSAPHHRGMLSVNYLLEDNIYIYLN